MLQNFIKYKCIQKLFVLFFFRRYIRNIIDIHTKPEKKVFFWKLMQWSIWASQNPKRMTWNLWVGLSSWIFANSKFWPHIWIQQRKKPSENNSQQKLGMQGIIVYMKGLTMKCSIQCSVYWRLHCTPVFVIIRDRPVHETIFITERIESIRIMCNTHRCSCRTVYEVKVNKNRLEHPTGLLAAVCAAYRGHVVCARVVLWARAVLKYALYYKVQDRCSMSQALVMRADSQRTVYKFPRFSRMLDFFNATLLRHSLYIGVSNHKLTISSFRIGCNLVIICLIDHPYSRS